jgi:hypothetical protein
VSCEPWTPDEIRAYFDTCIRAAALRGEFPACCGGMIKPNRLSEQTQRTICAVALEYPHATFESVMLARNELERQLDGTHLAEDRAMRAKSRLRLNRP